MSRKDYVLIAKVLADHSANLPDGLVSDLCELFYEDNPNFDSGKFFQACYPKEVEANQ
jgi:hypothetical protein|tara:strand:- start:564 stop:737 length:174 start_codon:yes stop_codon:yes gene_type:complete